jgi:hypothetical protein
MINHQNPDDRLVVLDLLPEPGSSRLSGAERAGEHCARGQT